MDGDREDRVKGAVIEAEIDLWVFEHLRQIGETDKHRRAQKVPFNKDQIDRIEHREGDEDREPDDKR